MALVFHHEPVVHVILIRMKRRDAANGAQEENAQRIHQGICENSHGQGGPGQLGKHFRNCLSWGLDHIRCEGISNNSEDERSAIPQEDSSGSEIENQKPKGGPHSVKERMAAGI